MATCRGTGQESAEAIVGERKQAQETPGKTYPAEGPNTEKGRTSMSSHDTKNPHGGVHTGRIVEPFDPNERLLDRILTKETKPSVSSSGGSKN